ncbi:hypothetical protein RYZ26_12560 [Terasakiella sp. A23]|uniref:hypothetical protein n=1 Tax=Terasakiella sp. FCG-A23 TaxID=3080561 RepID=UPI002953826F|nr:hypothetical protein [Terasakiella sp. A23]MDV7340429.1 hypothetical protein [Terasakiella sp. A23]
MTYIAHILLFLTIPLFFEAVMSYARFSKQVAIMAIEDEAFSAAHNSHPDFIQFSYLTLLAGLCLIFGALLLKMVS